MTDLERSGSISAQPDVQISTQNGKGDPEPGRRRWTRVLLAVAVAGLLVLAAGGVVLDRAINPPGGPGAPVRVTIARGSSVHAIASVLAARGVVSHALLFRLYVKLRGGGPFQAGIYAFRRHMGMGAAVKVLQRGPLISYERLTVPEGFTLEQIAARVGRLPGRSAQRFLASASNGQVRSPLEPAGSNNLEGLLLPETYLLDEHDDEAAILRRMVDAFAQEAASLGADYRTVIVASMVEREAKVAVDRGPIARVILNRLAAGQPLQVDATVRYGLHKQTGTVLFKDLAVDTPYNTYRHTGLPPTPIACPGRSALQAALHPPPGPWLYYVLADASGKHAFATTIAEFNRLKAAAERKGLLSG